MTYVEIALLLAGIALLVIGYRRDRRNMLVTAAIVLFFAGSLGPLVDGFMEGWSASATTAHAASR